MNKLLGIIFMVLCIVGCGNDHGGVQLWENGPYWAECNIGATKPEECGYYFWWGDTIGYLYDDGRWISAKDGEIVKFSYSSVTNFDSGIFVKSGIAASTYGKNESALLSAGYIDSSGKLAPAHDAATVHLGSPWRMPTGKDFDDLNRYCTTMWTTLDGVYGILVTGTGDYTNKSIFLPAAGCTYNSRCCLPHPYLGELGKNGYYWVSTSRDYSPDAHGGYYSRAGKISTPCYSPDAYGPYFAPCLYFSEGVSWSPVFGMAYNGSKGERYSGRSVRPVRDFAIKKAGEKDILRSFLGACESSKYDIAAELIGEVDKTNVDVQLRLGQMYANGWGVTQDVDEAVKWYRKAAEQGDANAQCNLGFMYEEGRGVTKDDREAVKWFRKSAEQGNLTAQLRLFNMYIEGRGVMKDDYEAVRWIRKAAEQGIAAAQYGLGAMYLAGRGVTKDDDEAVKWFRKAAEQGDAEAQCLLGVMYANGRGVTKDDDEAVKWFRKAAAQGEENAKKELKNRGYSE